MDLAGKVAIVTGGASGLGRGAVEASVKSAVQGVVEKFGALHICNNFAENDYLNGESIRLDGAIRMQPR